LQPGTHLDLQDSLPRSPEHRCPWHTGTTADVAELGHPGPAATDSSTSRTSCNDVSDSGEAEPDY
jgi:hypothetical protein